MYNERNVSQVEEFLKPKIKNDRSDFEINEIVDFLFLKRTVSDCLVIERTSTLWTFPVERSK